MIIMIVSIAMIIMINMPLGHAANETPFCARQHLAVVSATCTDEALPHRLDDDGEKHAKTKMMV